MHKPIEAVVFDVGGVLIDWNPLYLYRQLLPSEAAAQRFVQEVCTSEWNRGFDEGRPMAEGITELIERHPEHRDLISAYQLRGPEMLGGALDGTVEILGELRRNKTPLHAISNWSGETFPIARERFPFLSWFDVVVVSGDRKMAKPDPRVFQLLLAEASLEPQSCVFIDDNLENIAAAGKLGFRTIHFQDPDALRDELVRLNLLTGSAADGAAANGALGSAP
jgi:2-haloacid dehalogenase